MNINNLILFPKEIYAIEQFLIYDYYYETVLLWEELIVFSENLLEQYNANLSPNHRLQHLSYQSDYVWGSIVLPNLKGTLEHLKDGLEDLKAGFLPILRRMSSINNDVIALSRDFSFDWMDLVYVGARKAYKEKERLVSARATNIYIVNDHYSAQRDYKRLFDEDCLIGINFPKNLPEYKLNSGVRIKTGEPIMMTGIYRSTEPFAACMFLMKELYYGAEHAEDWKVAPMVYAFSKDPDLIIDPDLIENSREVPTTWILVERVSAEQSTSYEHRQRKSVRGGEAATVTGYWFSPAVGNRRQYFKQGDQLPVLAKSDWGDVYWYFDAVE